jgi:hypothetical protein
MKPVDRTGSRFVVFVLALFVAINAHCIVVCNLTQAPMPMHCHGHNCGKCAPQQPPFDQAPATTFAPAAKAVALVSPERPETAAAPFLEHRPLSTGPPLTTILRV